MSSAEQNLKSKFDLPPENATMNDSELERSKAKEVLEIRQSGYRVACSEAKDAIKVRKDALKQLKAAEQRDYLAVKAEIERLETQ